MRHDDSGRCGRPLQHAPRRLVVGTPISFAWYTRDRTSRRYYCTDETIREVPLTDWRLSDRPPSVFHSRVPIGGGGGGGDRRRLPSLAIDERVKHPRVACLCFRGKTASVTRPRAVEQRKTDRQNDTRTVSAWYKTWTTVVKLRARRFYVFLMCVYYEEKHRHMRTKKQRNNNSNNDNNRVGNWMVNDFFFFFTKTITLPRSDRARARLAGETSAKRMEEKRATNEHDSDGDDDGDVRGTERKVVVQLSRRDCHYWSPPSTTGLRTVLLRTRRHRRTH